MQSKPLTSKAYFSSLTMIHSALLSGIGFISMIAWYLVHTENFVPRRELEETFHIVVLLVVLASLSGSLAFVGKRLKSARTKATLKEKLQDYRMVLITKYAMMEGPALFALVAYLLIGHYLFLGWALLIMGLLIVARPSKERTIIDLELGGDEKDLLEDPEALVA